MYSVRYIEMDLVQSRLRTRASRQARFLQHRTCDKQRRRETNVRQRHPTLDGRVLHQRPGCWLSFRLTFVKIFMCRQHFGDLSRNDGKSLELLISMGLDKFICQAQDRTNSFARLRSLICTTNTSCSTHLCIDRQGMVSDISPTHLTGENSTLLLLLPKVKESKRIYYTDLHF